MIREVHLVLEENQATTGARFVVGFVAQRIISAEALGRFAAANAAGDVIFFVDEIVPERNHGALIIQVVRLRRDIRHAGEKIRRAHRVADGLVLLLDGRLALVVFRAAAPAIEQKFRELDVAVAVAAALHVVHETAEPHERLLHFLVAVEPFLFARPDVRHPAIRQFFRRIVKPLVLAAGKRVMIDGRLDEIAGGVALVIAAALRRPSLAPDIGVAERPRGLQIAVRLLRGEDFRDPILQRRLHFVLRGDDVRVALRIHHQRDAHGFDRLMNPRVRENVAFLRSMRFAAQRLRRLDKIVNAAVALAGRDVGPVDLVNAMRNPVHDERLCPRVPQQAVNLVRLRINHIEPLRRWRGHHLHAQCGRRAQIAIARSQLENIIARFRKNRRRVERARVFKSRAARPGILVPQNFRRQIRLQKFYRAGQIRFAVEHHVAIHAGGNCWRKIRRFARIQNAPLQNARGKIAVPVHFQPEFRRRDFVERRHV